MKSIASKDAKDGFGKLLDDAQKEPVRIQKHGRDVAVVISMEEYKRLSELEDQIWATRARQAEKVGFVGTKRSESFLKELLHAED
jgi:prevent-host-death family protein